jgi:hypothetical protein
MGALFTRRIIALQRTLFFCEFPLNIIQILQEHIGVYSRCTL